MPIVLGHEAAGIVEATGPDARGIGVADHVVLSWNPYCGHCFYCDRDLPILSRHILHVDRRQSPLTAHRAPLSRTAVNSNCSCIWARSANTASCQTNDRACLIGCGVMTGVGAALNIARIG